jgi:hypothetical protein
MVKAVGYAPSTIHRLWRAFGLQPHRALVLCVDEKSQLQAPDRIQPLLPMRPGQVEWRSHDYACHGITPILSGVAPVTKRSGKTHIVVMRYAAQF